MYQKTLSPLTVCFILHLYHQDLSANAIVAERSMTHVSTNKTMHELNIFLEMTREEREERPKLVFGNYYIGIHLNITD